MFKRKIEEELQRWKDNPLPHKGAFLLKGLRQIGKTTTIMAFGKKNYDFVFDINFKLEPQYKAAFSGPLDVATIIANLSAYKPGIPFLPKKTLLFFDEIQECSGARACLKSFAEDGRFDVIASGSMLGIKGYNGKYNGGIPVGSEHSVIMFPMDFEEFLWAKGISSDITNLLKESFLSREPISPAIHEAMTRYFREYICVGGMPAVVDVFLRTNDFSQVLSKQRDILEGYKDDYGKHLDDKENEKLDKTLLARINSVFQSIPAQLAKPNQKFTYALLGKKASSAQYEPAIQWLHDYGLIQFCYCLSSPSKPLEGNKIPDIFKIYMADTGLFIAMLDEGTQSDILQGNIGIYKGAIYGNAIADVFGKKKKPLYYFSKSSGLEIDFITLWEKEIALVEVKARDGNAKSAKVVLGDKVHYPDVQNLIKINEKNISSIPGGFSIPQYLSYLL